MRRALSGMAATSARTAAAIAALPVGMLLGVSGEALILLEVAAIVAFLSPAERRQPFQLPAGHVHVGDGAAGMDDLVERPGGRGALLAGQ